MTKQNDKPKPKPKQSSHSPEHLQRIRERNTPELRAGVASAVRLRERIARAEARLANLRAKLERTEKRIASFQRRKASKNLSAAMGERLEELLRLLAADLPSDVLRKHGIIGDAKDGGA